MGWAHCGVDSNGRPIGSAHEATCDHPDCKVKIDRGLSYTCGPTHGEDDISCEGYFCEKHRVVVELSGGEALDLCLSCAELAEREGMLAEDEGS